MVEKLLPCPFCKWPGKLKSQDGVSWVECIDCACEGPPEDDEPTAIAAWNTRAPADLRSALEAETIREAAGYAGELREIAGMLAQSPDGPLRWKQYRLIAVTDYLNALTALAPTKGDAS